MAKQSFTTGQVLTAAQMTSLQQTAMLGGDATAKTVNYVLVAADAGTVVTMNAAGATTITVNTGLFAAGDIVTIINLGAGVSTITAGTATVTTSGSLALSQNEGGVLRFTSASEAIFLQFATPPASSGGMTLISETTASALSSLSFSSLGSYKQLLLLWNGLSHSASGSQFSIRFNNSSGNNYYQGGIAATSGGGFTAYSDTATSLRCTGGGSNGSYPFGNDAYSTYGPYGFTGSLLIDDYTSTTKKKFYQAEWYYNDEASASRKIAQISGAWNDTSAITSIDIVRLTGTATFSNATNSSIRLYGVS